MLVFAAVRIRNPAV